MESLLNLTVELDIVGGGQLWTVNELEIVKAVAKTDIFQLVLPGAMLERMVGLLIATSWALIVEVPAIRVNVQIPGQSDYFKTFLLVSTK